MINFTVDEITVLKIFHDQVQGRKEVIDLMSESLPLQPNPEIVQITESVIAKVAELSDEEYEYMDYTDALVSEEEE